MRTPILMTCLVTSFLSACAQTSHLAYYHKTVVGFNASASTQPTSGQILLGYDRRMIALVPKTQPDPGKPDAYEAMSVISCVEARNRQVFSIDFEERLATGEAADNYAKNIERNKGQFFRCFDASAENQQQGVKR